MNYTVLDDNRAKELRQIFFDKFEVYSKDGMERSLETGLEILRRQGRIYAIVDTRVISIEGMELAEMICGLFDMQDECIYCFDDGIANGSWMLAFTKQTADGRVCCLYNDWRTDSQGELFKGEKLYRRKYRAFPESDHEHCAMCWAKFSEYDGNLKIGWCNHDKPDVNSSWVCDECFCDLKQLLDWHE